MTDRPRTITGRARSSGFSLIELMIAVAIISVLVAIAIPSYQESVRKSRRSEAINAINQVQQAQERSRGRFPTYCSDLTSTETATACGLKVPSTTSSGYYSLAVSNTSDADAYRTGYIVTATAASSQANDALCTTLAFKMDGGTVTFGSGTSSTIDWTDAHRCWSK